MRSRVPWPIRISLAATCVLVLLIAWAKIIHITTTKGFGPHGECLLWLPNLLTLYVGSDSSIGTSYVIISATLIYFVYRNHRTVPFRWVFIAFGVFIIACGTTHYMDILTLWIPMYWLSGTIKLCTAVASVTTATALPFQIPKIQNLMKKARAEEEHREQLEQAHQILQREAESRNKSVVDLAQEMVETYERQREFVATASHEIRTALQGISGFSEVLKLGEYSTEEVQEYATDIHNESSRLGRLIGNLLDIEQIRSGRMTIIFEPVCLNTLIEKVLERNSFSSHDHTFHLHLDSRLPKCRGDADKLTQVLTNLVSNAIKYSPAGGKITIGSQFKDGMVQAWVQDQGIGIPSQFLDDVFKPYERVEGASLYIKGTGLGLSISQQIIGMHEGRIWVESENGKGSCFRFTIPRYPGRP